MESGQPEKSTTSDVTTEELSLMEIMDKLTNGPQLTQPQDPCSCKDPSEGVAKGCCVVICLKTLEALKYLVMQKDVLACKSRSGNSLTATCSGMLNKQNNNNNMACCSSAV